MWLGAPKISFRHIDMRLTYGQHEFIISISVHVFIFIFCTPYFILIPSTSTFLHSTLYILHLYICTFYILHSTFLHSTFYLLQIRIRISISIKLVLGRERKRDQAYVTPENSLLLF